jgi:hypothetical protein
MSAESMRPWVQVDVALFGSTFTGVAGIAASGAQAFGLLNFTELKKWVPPAMGLSICVLTVSTLVRFVLGESIRFWNNWTWR